jgi:hypothetical protein
MPRKNKDKTIHLKSYYKISHEIYQNGIYQQVLVNSNLIMMLTELVLQANL